MTHAHTQKNILPKTLAVFLLLALIVPSLVSHSAIAQTVAPSGMVSLESLIQIPKVTINENVFPDISRIDWEQKVVINGKSIALNSDEALGVLDLSPEIKDIVKMYRDDTTSVKNDGLQFSIAKKLIESGELPTDYFDLDAQGFVEPANIIDIKNAQIFNSDNAVGVSGESTAKIIGMKEEVSGIQSVQKMGIASADTISINSAISVSGNAISYLVSQQNADGSWGSNTKTQFITTVAVLEALKANSVTGAEMDKGIEWISTYFADNTDYLAQKFNVVIPAGEPASTAETLIYKQDTSLGGFPFDDGYQSDPLTTARVIQALSAVNYKDPGAEPNATQSLALKYLINTKRFDNGWSVFDSGISNIPVTSEVIEALLLWRHRTLGATVVDNTLNPAVSTLTSIQMSNGTWGNDVLNTALAYHAIKAAGATPTYQTETLQYFENEQAGNGSFSNDIYKTAKVLQAFSVSTDSGQLVISDIIPQTILQTGTTAEYNLVISNTGNTAVDSGVIHIVADGYLLESFDFEGNNIVINANSTLDITIGIANTRNLQGNVVFKAFIEGVNGIVHPNSRYEETLTFVADPIGRPALPMYYVAYKSVSSGTPAITWRWPAKADPNLNKYVVMWRKLGTINWSTGSGSYPATSATASSLTTDEIYEATIGTSDSLGNIYYFSGNVSQVKVSASPATYIAGTVSGKVKAIEGTVSGVDVLGVNAATNTVSLPDGSYTQSNVPWGSGYARVSNFRYENYVNKYTNANINLTDVDVFTNLRPDTANPTVSNVSIVGEPDKVMENNQKKLIEYTVGDDIGPGGGIVASASIYYYDPHDSNWHLIAVEQGFLTGTRTYEWDIPSTLLGAGYKIKVIARDFAGKDSAGAEWGDFEITTAPPLLPSLIASPSGVTGGDTITVNFANIPTPIALDWFGLYTPTSAANAAFDPSNWKYANSCTTTPGNSALASGSCTFVMPNVAGDYQFRLLANNGTSTVLASSNTVTVAAPSSLPTLTASPNNITPGGTVTVTFSNLSTPTLRDWISRYTLLDQDSNYDTNGWVYTSASPNCSKNVGLTPLSSGSCTFVMPNTPGDYQFRLFANNGSTKLTTSNTVTVASPPSLSTLTASPSIVNRDGIVTVNFANVSTPAVKDWIGIYYPISKANAEYDPNNWKYANSCSTTPGASGLSSGSCIFTMPNVAGEYQFRLLANDGIGIVLASSNTVTVDIPTLSVGPNNVNGGATVTANFTNVPSSTPMDWIGVYSGTDAPDSEYSSDWKYTSSCSKTAGASGLSSGSCTFVMPNVVGDYQFRLFANNGGTLLATSNIVTVTVPTLAVSSNAVHVGETVTVNFANVLAPTALDWFGLYSPIGVANNAFDPSNWKYANSCSTTPGASGLSSGSCTFTIPNVAGEYQFRLLANNGTSTVIVSSNTVTVSNP